MKTILCILLGLLMGEAVFADDLDGIDQSTTSTVTPRTWEPMITEFFAAASNGSASLITSPGETPRSKDVLGEASQWQLIKPIIAPRGDDVTGIGSYKDDESVLSAWHRMVNDQGQVEFRTFGSNGATSADGKPSKPMIHAIYCKDHTIRLIFDLDILMNEKDPDKKDQIVKDYFKIAEISVTARKIADDPANFRAGVPANPNPAGVFKILTVGGPTEAVGEDFAARAHAWSAARHGSVDWSFLVPANTEVGVFEYRIKARVNGRFSSQEDYTSKTIEGAIRVASVNNKETEIIKLTWQSARQPGQVDFWNNKGVPGTRQK